MKKGTLLIADSGSTKTDWLLLDNGRAVASHTTQGINPFMLESHDIRTILTNELIAANSRFIHPDAIYFYGAGCRSDMTELLAQVLNETLLPASAPQVESDMLGAARALLGHSEGIACILGTGSNSCLYDGNRIANSVPSLGYILGDEGSGASLGRRLAADVCKGQLSSDICRLFFEETGLTTEEIIARVYRQPFPNRFLASLTPFLARHREDPPLHALLTDEFTRFFQRNISAYKRPELTVNFVGSIAAYFSAELEESAHAIGFQIGQIMQKPLEELAKYHAELVV